MDQDWIGSLWLAREYGAEPVQRVPVSSRIGRTRSETTTDGWTIRTCLESARPKLPAEHLAFALRHEGVHLEFLARLFAKMPAAVLEEWINREPSGQYARRVGFLFEWLTGKDLDFPGVTVGNYVSALPEEEYFTRSSPANSSRWRVRDNLPGTRTYCPTVRRTPKVRAIEAFDCRSTLDELETEFGADILLRSAVWLTIKESRASFQIESEASESDRIRRFASVMERRLGEDWDPLMDSNLASLQAEILGERAMRRGQRRSPVFVGESGRFGEVVHYVAPHWDSVGGLLAGLRGFEKATRGKASIVRAAVLSFGFVFIHPMTDGNGRISRFLVNDVLRRDLAVPAPFMLPISATITHSVANRAAYDQALERYSRPLMSRFAESVGFGPTVVCEDGVQTNFRFDGYEDASPTWAFPDLTSQTEYLGAVIDETLQSEMRQEASFLVDIHQTRLRVKEVIEAPDVEIDRMIRSVRENNGLVSGKLRREFPILEEPGLADDLVRAVQKDA